MEEAEENFISFSFLIHIPLQLGKSKLNKKKRNECFL
jgi:hypothetical protein